MRVCVSRFVVNLQMMNWLNIYIYFFFNNSIFYAISKSFDSNWNSRSILLKNECRDFFCDYKIRIVMNNDSGFIVCEIDAMWFKSKIRMSFSFEMKIPHFHDFVLNEQSTRHFMRVQTHLLFFSFDKYYFRWPQFISGIN